jgi:DNA polymerase III psi subunit
MIASPVRPVIIADHMMQLQIHLVQRLLHALDMRHTTCSFLIASPARRRGAHCRRAPLARRY